jgi:hypothetical protein
VLCAYQIADLAVRKERDYEGVALGWVTRDISPSLDANAFMLKSASLHMEMVFSKILNGNNFESQGNILEDVAALVVQGRVRTIATTRLQGRTAETKSRPRAR